MSSQRRSVLFATLLALSLFFGHGARAAASPPPSVVVVTPVFAESVSWRGFVKYWKGFVKNSDRVVVIVALVGLAALFIITRGKWMH